MAYVICIDNTGYAASLERQTIYKAVHDARAARHGLVRVVDESGESYLFPAELFQKVPQTRPNSKAISTEVKISAAGAAKIRAALLPKRSGAITGKRKRKKRQGVKSGKAVA